MSKPKRFVVISDSHGDMQDDQSINAMLAFCNDFKPAIRVHAGDLFDFRNLRRGASDDEKAGDLEADWDAGMKLFDSFFEKGCENHFLLGNHDDRLWQFERAASDGVKRAYAREGIERIRTACARRRVKMLPYDAALGILKLGHLSVLHGYHAGVSAARQHANCYGNCIFGHVHDQSVAAVPSLEPAEARSIGCLCIRDMDYINAKTAKLRWAQGWAYGYLFENGTYQLFLTRKINGTFNVATEIRSY